MSEEYALSNVKLSVDPTSIAVGRNRKTAKVYSERAPRV